MTKINGKGQGPRALTLRGIRVKAQGLWPFARLVDPLLPLGPFICMLGFKTCLNMNFVRLRTDSRFRGLVVRGLITHRHIYKYIYRERWKYRSIQPSIHWSIHHHPSIYLVIYLSVHLSVLSISLSINLSIYLSRTYLCIRKGCGGLCIRMGWLRCEVV